MSCDFKCCRRKPWLILTSLLSVDVLVATTNNMKVLRVANHILVQLHRRLLLELHASAMDFALLRIAHAFAKAVPETNVEISAVHTMKCK